MKRILERINTVLHAKTFFSHPKTAAVVLAGGSGQRMGSDMPKQFLSICGVPVLVHSLRAFAACKSIDEIIVVTREEDIPKTEELCRDYNISKVTAIVAGGKTRAESAANGFRSVSEGMTYVAFHDAARCLITPRQIKDVATAAYAYRAATAATPVTDSIKTANRYMMIENDVPREELWAAGTPQIFHCVYYAAALREAEKNEASVTDDNSLMELIGQRVKLVDVGPDNFKITYRHDIARAESVLRDREGSHGK